MKQVGTGIFMWGGPERQSGRYGAFYMSPDNLNGDVEVPNRLDIEAIQDLSDSGVPGIEAPRRVRLMARVIETRTSGHIGDVFLGIKPSTPRVGEEVVLGVGYVTTKPVEWAPHLIQVVVAPEDGRTTNWLDPRVLYRLHDQTVELFAEPTEDPCHPDPQLKARTEGVISNGDGSFQVRGVDPESIDRVQPRFQRLGEGLFSMGLPGEGEYVEHTEK